jgi:hypothetical protein
LAARQYGHAGVDVTAPRQCRRPGIHAQHISLAADEVTQERGIPVTTPARTLRDRSSVLNPHHLEPAGHDTEYRPPPGEPTASGLDGPPPCP